ncbi:hypothetical protein P154DRAFT_529231 [Amniculicola lignicola CBS 123094]|uniref:Uncharacterized protein n=1 Tax=Amniculicola lignicola CBS 123094 TaxID=1392246 RepID=A0A6A5WYB7_9PLEO|nr:hypothetical protein P154DRAFT_529231 [Amniculicola lignicola CBS 123094]
MLAGLSFKDPPPLLDSNTSYSYHRSALVPGSTPNIVILGNRRAASRPHTHSLKELIKTPSSPLSQKHSTGITSVLQAFGTVAPGCIPSTFHDIVSLVHHLQAPPVLLCLSPPNVAQNKRSYQNERGRMLAAKRAHKCAVRLPICSVTLPPATNPPFQFAPQDKPTSLSGKDLFPLYTYPHQLPISSGLPSVALVGKTRIRVRARLSPKSAYPNPSHSKSTRFIPPHGAMVTTDETYHSRCITTPPSAHSWL